jgi:prolyl-tRNA editing enzyme YbaK/EbsC (Cys-tRNA(Pro) deacylase)
MNERLVGLVKELETKNIEFRLVELTDKAMTVKDVIKFSKGNVEVDEICKTIIWKTNRGLVGVFLKGDSRINLGKLQKFLNSKVTMASSEEVKEKTGLEPGAVCPLLLGIPLVMDKQVFDLKKVNFGSGDHLYEIEMNPNDILNVTKARVAKLSE